MTCLPSTRTVIVVLLACTALASPATGIDTGTDRPSLTQPDTCSAPDSGRLESDAYAYVDRLDNSSRDNWTGGTTVPVGAHGDCSLAVVNGTASLSTATVDSRTGTLVATVDLARGGTFRVGTPPDANRETAGVSIENVGASYSDRLAVVVQSPTGETNRTELTAPGGRFVDVAMAFREDGTVDVVVWDPELSQPDDWDVTANVTTERANWTVQLTARSYLDELAIGTAATPSQSPDAGTDGGDEDAGADDGDEEDVFDRVDEYEESAGPDGPTDDTDDGNPGLIMGPLLVVFGVLSYRFAYSISRFGEQLDAIGSKTRWAEVEPAEWNVWLTKVMAAGVAVAGIAWFSTAL
jgi:hypothetical protein